MSDNKKYFVIFFIIFASLFITGCMDEQSRDKLEVGKEYEIIDIKFFEDKSAIYLTFNLNNTFDECIIHLVERDDIISDYYATGVYVPDNRTYFKLIRNEKYKDYSYITSSSKYHFEIHMNNNYLKSHIK